ncbi:hypothetical protein ACVXZY_11880 [Staphylococcus aureus]
MLQMEQQSDMMITEMTTTLNVARGIRLNADKIDINGNREINLLIQNMRDKVDKTDIVNSLNL